MSWFMRHESDEDDLYVYCPSGRRYRAVTAAGVALHLKRLSQQIARLGDTPDALILRADQDELLSAYCRLLLESRKTPA